MAENKIPENKVQCAHCGEQYDLGLVTVISRRTDCSIWKAPCCNRTVDDRTWKGLPDFRRITNDLVLDVTGRLVYGRRM